MKDGRRPSAIPKSLRRTARGVAVHVLATPGVFAQDELHRAFEKFGVLRRDRALATELVLGCTRHDRLIDHLIAHFTRRPHARARLPRSVQAALAIGVYQLIWMDQMPAHAAISETVELTKAIDRGAFSGVVNAILRNVQRSIVSRELSAGPETPPSPRRIWLDATRMCELNFDLLPDPDAAAIGYWSLATSHDPFLIARWRERKLPFERIALAGICRPTVCLRPNLLRTDSARLAESLRGEGCEVALARDDLGVYLLSGPPLTELDAFQAGLCQPQDPTAARVVARWLRPQPGERVLDLCAAPGTKSTQIAELMANQGVVVATDASEAGLELLNANCHRMGIEIIRIVPRAKLSEAAARWGPFDKALVDAPCSNTGVLARRPEAKRIGRLSAERLTELQELQAGLLTEAVGYVRPGGHVVYSTCSLETQENEQVVARVLSAVEGITLEEQDLAIPEPGASSWHDGGYVAKLRRQE